MSEEKTNPKEVVEHEVASWNFNLSSVVPFLIIIPLTLYLVGKLFGWSEVEKVGGYIAAGVLGIFLIAFVTNLIWWRKFIGSAEAKTKRAQAVIQQITADDSLVLQIEARDNTILRVKSDHNNLVNYETGVAINKKDVESALITGKGFPRISKTP